MITRYGDLDRVEKRSSLLSQLGQQRKESLNMECLYRTAYLCFLKAKEARDHVANMYVTKMVKKGESMLSPVLKSVYARWKHIKMTVIMEDKFLVH